MNNPDQDKFNQAKKSERNVNVNVVNVDPITLAAIVAAVLLIPLLISGFVSH